MQTARTRRAALLAPENPDASIHRRAPAGGAQAARRPDAGFDPEDCRVHSTSVLYVISPRLGALSAATTCNLVCNLVSKWLLAVAMETRMETSVETYLPSGALSAARPTEVTKMHLHLPAARSTRCAANSLFTSKCADTFVTPRRLPISARVGGVLRAASWLRPSFVAPWSSAYLYVSRLVARPALRAYVAASRPAH